jgi:hypothetical protein
MHHSSKKNKISICPFAGKRIDGAAFLFVILYLTFSLSWAAPYFKEQVKQIKLISFRVANEDEQRDL